MDKIIFGVAFGQLLAMILVIALELTVSMAFWYLAELCWRGLVQGIRHITPWGGYAHVD